MFWTLGEKQSEYTSVFKALFWPYRLVQLEPVEPGSAVTIALGQETKAEE